MTETQKADVAMEVLQRDDPALVNTGRGLSSQERLTLAVAMVRKMSDPNQKLISPMTGAILHNKGNSPIWAKHLVVLAARQQIFNTTTLWIKK